MRIMVLGGDGFCGWATSLHLSSLGHEIHILDDFSRRKIDKQLGIQSLTPIVPLHERVNTWRRLGKKEITFNKINIAQEPSSFLYQLKTFKPEAIIHFAEQRAAPYSMKNFSTKLYTVNNNISATNNLLASVVELGLEGCHIIHLGTMGAYQYGTEFGRIPEGYMKVWVEKEKNNLSQVEILHPQKPGSLYHTTKCMDELLFYFYNKNDNLRITDLHQGIVWGTQTPQTMMHENLINRFDYDGDYGTVLNRFLVQASIDYPLTVHGIGGQTRAFININDTVKCIEIAINNPPERGERVKILNQMTEVYTIRRLAELIQILTGVKITNVPNPRKEASENKLDVENTTFLNYGLKPVFLKNFLIREIVDIAKKYSFRCNRGKIPCVSNW